MPLPHGFRAFSSSTFSFDLHSSGDSLPTCDPMWCWLAVTVTCRWVRFMGERQKNLTEGVS